MSISKSRGAYGDCRDLFERAEEDPKGCRIFIGEQGAARHFVMRMHMARDIDRKDNAEKYELGHHMYMASPWDKLKCSMKADAKGDYWVYIEKIELNIGAVENLSELVDYEFVHPVQQVVHKQALMIEHQPQIIRRRV